MFPTNSTSSNQGVYQREQQRQQQHESYVDTTNTTGSSISDAQLQQQQQHQLLRSWRNSNIVSASATSTSTTGSTATATVDVDTNIPIIDAGTPVTPRTTAAIIQVPGQHQQHLRNESIDMTTSSTIQSPPLAQVVLEEEYINQRNGIIGGIGGNSSLSNFPVANFVTNLVRSSIDTLHATTIQAMDRLGSTSSDTVPLYIRTVSDNDPSLVTPAAAVRTATAATVTPIDFLQQQQQQQSTLNYAQQQQEHQQQTQQQASQDSSSHYSSQNNNRTRTNTGVSTVDPTLTEYVVVDGEIIAIAPQTPTQVAQYQMETLIRQQRIESNNLFSVSGAVSSSTSLSLASTCQPKKVKGGVRRMIKLFRNRSKGKKNTIEQQQQQQQQQHQNLQSSSTSTPFLDTSIIAPTEDEPQQQQHMTTTTTNNMITQEFFPVVTDGDPFMGQQHSIQLQSTSNVPNSIDVLSLQIQQDQLHELYMHDINNEQNQQPDQNSSYHQQQQQHNSSRRRRRGTNLWKEKSKGLIDSNNNGNFSQYQQQQQQSETFSDLSRKEVRQERRQARRWGAGRRGGGGDIGGKKPPPSMSTTTPPRSQDLTTNDGTSNNINTNDGYEMFLVPAGTNNISTQNGVLRGNELLPVDTGLMPPVTSSMSMLQSSELTNQRNHLNSIDGLSFASTFNTATYHDPLNHSTVMNDYYVFDSTDIPPPNDQYEASVRGGGDILMPLPMPSSFGIDARAASVTASFVGVEDVTAHAHSAEHVGDYIPGQSVEAESFLEAVLSYDDYGDDYEYSRKKDECDDDDDNHISSYSVPKQYEKLDKAEDADAPDLDIMLLRAKEETRTDFTSQYDDDDDTPPMPFPAALSATSSASTCLKSDGASVVLSEATPNDPVVHNDILKVIMVSAPTVDKSWLARALRNSRRRAKNRTTLAVDVHEWKLPCPWKESKAFSTGSSKPSFDESESDTDFHTNDVKCMIWDIQGAATKQNDNKANFAVHPATQSLFFSAQSLFILVWDLACDNEATYWQKPGKRRTDDSDSDEDDDYDDFFEIQDAERKNRQADRILHADIFSRVLSWVDYIAEKGPMSGVLPVALIPENMCQEEVRRRIDILQIVLEMKSADRDWPKMLTATDSIIRVQYRPSAGKNKEPIEGIDQLQDLIAGIAHDSSHQVFSHVGTPVPDGTVLVLDCIRRFKQEHKLIPFDFLIYELGSLLDTERIINALHFLSSIGEIMYFGHSEDEVLSKFIVLSHTWLVSALSCILRNDLKRELIESRGFMNLQSFYDEKRYEENEMIRALNGDSDSNLPLLSDEDAKMLWQNLNFMREAADRSSQFEERALWGPNIFYFLEKLLVDSGIFLPLQPSTESETKVFFVPSLLVEVIPTNIWTYKNSDAYMTTLCHSWLFRDGAPSQLMEHIVVKLLRSIYDFSIEFPMPDPGTMQHARTDPLTHRGMDSFMGSHNSDQIGSIRINQLLCWKSSFSIKIDSVYVDESGKLKKSTVEMFVGVCGQSSGLCVATEDMHPGMQRVVVSGKGLVGHHAKKLWRGGYRLVLDTIRSALSSYSNVDEQIICPHCLEELHPRDASTFMWNSVYAAATGGNAHVHCMKGHRVDTNLMCGTRMDTRPTHVQPQNVGNKDVRDVLQGVVIVGLWDPAKNAIVHAGSGFIVNRKLGLIVSAGHTLFTMKGEQFGAMHMGIPNAKVVVGVIVDDNHTALFRYWAEIVTHEIHRIDACVLRIVSRMNNDVADDGAGCATQPVTALTTNGINEQNLTSLKVTKTFEIQESIRILGFNQGGEGIFKQGTHVNRVADVAMGYICRKFETTQSDSSSTSSSSSTGSETERLSFTPQKEIVIICPTINGHSGGPCVNNEGKVIGILSRSDPVEKSRCYLVPATELKSLINQARAIVERY